MNSETSLSKQQEFALFEYNFDQSNTNLNLNTSEIDARLTIANKKLEKYVNNADTLDYAVAVASGIFSGILDSIFVKPLEMDLISSIKIPKEKLGVLIKNVAKENGFEKGTPIEAISFIRNKYSEIKPDIQKLKLPSLNIDNPLKDHTNQPTMLGLVSSLGDSFLRYGIFIKEEDSDNLFPFIIQKETLKNIWLPVFFSGISSWLVRSYANFNEDNNYGPTNELPDAIIKIMRLLKEVPVASEILTFFNEGCDFYINNIKNKPNQNNSDNKISFTDVFILFIQYLSQLSILQDTKLPAIAENISRLKQVKIQNTLGGLTPIKDIIDKQAMPVLIDEAFVRMFYFVRRLINEIRNKNITSINQCDQIDWENVIPFENRTITRMMTISTEVFMGVDMLDAVRKAAADSAGIWMVFLERFATNINYVGMGRFTIAVFQDLYYDFKEEESLTEVRILKEERSAQVVSAIEEYTEKIKQLVASYLCEDISEFLSSMDELDIAISNNDSNGFIHGNVRIQKVLGRDPQFTTQEEFDDLMSSDDISLIL